MKTVLTILMVTITGLLFAQQSKPNVLGNIDFNTLIKATPKLQATPETAYEYVCNKNLHCDGVSKLKIQFDDFNTRKEVCVSKFKGYTASQTYTAASSKEQANQNGLIQSMGGQDKVMQMSDKERKEAAKNAIASKAASSKFSIFTEAETKRMMSDPAYAKEMAAKYMNMTEKQKKDLVIQKAAAANLNESTEDYEKRLKDQKANKNASFINDFANKNLSRLTQATDTYLSKIQDSKRSSGNHEELDASYEKEYLKIPILQNEWSKYRDPATVKKLKINFALRHKNRALVELSDVQIEYKKLASTINEVISEYKPFVDKNENEINSMMSSDFNGTTTEFCLIQLEKRIIGAIDMLSKISYTENSLASKQEQNYQMAISEE